MIETADLAEYVLTAWGTADRTEEAFAEIMKHDVYQLPGSGLVSSEIAEQIISELEQTTGTEPAQRENHDPQIDDIAVIRRLSELENHAGNDPNCLLGNRYLSGGGGLLFVAPTGTGKSSAMTQTALLWAVGKPAFGIYPTRKIKTLIVQAENDDGDLAEMRDGVLSGMIEAGIITEAEAMFAIESVFTVRDVCNTRDDVGPALGRYIKQTRVDLVILDPVFSFIGGDTNSAADVGHFLRNVINPVILKHNVGFIAVHHSNKPIRGEQKGDWAAGDFAYLGAGSAEFANWARAVLAIRSLGSHDVYQLVAGKRGKRIGWTDDEGYSIMTRFIKHAERGICWLDADESDVRTAAAKQSTAGEAHISARLPEAREIALKQVWKIGQLKAELANCMGLTSGHKLQELVKLLSEQNDLGRACYYEGRTPVYLIGPKRLVSEAVPIRNTDCLLLSATAKQ